MGGGTFRKRRILLAKYIRSEWRYEGTAKAFSAQLLASPIVPSASRRPPVRCKDFQCINDNQIDIHVWKTECSPLMIQQKGCVSEKLLRCREAHESSPIWNGIPKLISSSIETAMPIRRSCGMLGD